MTLSRTDIFFFFARTGHECEKRTVPIHRRVSRISGTHEPSETSHEPPCAHPSLQTLHPLRTGHTRNGASSSGRRLPHFFPQIPQGVGEDA